MATYVATKTCNVEGTLVAAGDELLGVSPGCLESMLRTGLAAEAAEPRVDSRQSQTDGSLSDEPKKQIRPKAEGGRRKAE